jgi:hypothetical protein
MNSRGRGRGYGGGRSSSHAPPRIIMNSRGGSGRGRGRGDGGGRVSHPSLQTQHLGLRVSMINNRNGSNEAGGLALHRRSDVSVLSGGASSSGAAGRGGGGGTINRYYSIRSIVTFSR